jgi:hypothetical protein
LIGARQASALSSRWRRQLQALIEEHRRDFYAVLTGFRRYSPAELSVLWVERDRCRQNLGSRPQCSTASTRLQSCSGTGLERMRWKTSRTSARN